MITSQNMVDEVISRLDLRNRESVTIEGDILPALNRGWDDAISIVARRSEEFLLTQKVMAGLNPQPNPTGFAYGATTQTGLQLDANGDYFFLYPPDCYQQRLLGVDVHNFARDFWYPVQLNNAQDSYKNELGNLRVGIRRMQYYQLGRKLILLPREDCKYVTEIRIRYIKRPPPLALPQGKITSWDVTNGFLSVDALGPDISPVIGQTGNYFNIIDAHDGEIITTHQVMRIDGNKVFIRPAPIRSEFHDYTVTGTLPDGSVPGIQALDYDDYICAAPYSCVPFIETPVTALAIEYAISEMQRKLGETDQNILNGNVKKREDRVNDLAVNRPRSKRRKSSAPWTSRKY